MQGQWESSPSPLSKLFALLQVEVRDGLIRVPEGSLTVWSGTAALYCARRTPCQRVSWAPPTVSLRKEVIQPQVLLRLPCYDFTPIMNHTLGRCLPCGLARRLLVQSTFVM